MNIKTKILTLTAAAITLALPMPLHAAKGAKKEGKGDKAGRPGMILRKYDTNKNHVIDGDEIAALRKAYEANKTGPLKQFDTNNDGTIDDTEIAAIKGHAKGEKGAKGAKPAGKKKKAA